MYGLHQLGVLIAGRPSRDAASDEPAGAFIDSGLRDSGGWHLRAVSRTERSVPGDGGASRRRNHFAGW
jgi:hypothetical protein